MMRRSSTKCRCGHVFDPATIAKKVARRCPLCGKQEDGAAASCACGYDFSTPAHDIKRQLVRRKRIGGVMIVVGVLGVVASGFVIWLAQSVIGGSAIAISGAASIARGMSAISWTRGELKELEARELPVARLLE